MVVVGEVGRTWVETKDPEVKVLGRDAGNDLLVQ